MLTDPIADMLTRIRNANKVKAATVSMPSSNEKVEITKILVSEGYVDSYIVEGDAVKTLTITLKYTSKGERVLTDLKKVSKPGLRVYSPVEKLPRVLNGLGIAIVSTSKGLLTDKQCRKENVGGEVIALVY
jgi:small subunit ribosomal protein S8